MPIFGSQYVLTNIYALFKTLIELGIFDPRNAFGSAFEWIIISYFPLKRVGPGASCVAACLSI